MSIREYSIEDPSTIKALVLRIFDVLICGGQVEVTAAFKADELSVQRGSVEERTFTLTLVSAECDTEERQILAQDTKTLEWVSMTLTSEAITIMVVS